eukprot:TRINITY_DN4340_c0_g5_i2.p1 TRINITY_DN4340_c0_g5~~TRINITY_DN4340_c0_g5_i2.p1  ORF type:complete len:264 (+),score=36.51 TRINITY_DN4340_c0_g5_i2:92-793(+)
MPSLEEAALADRMYSNFEKLVRKSVQQDKYRPQIADRQAGDECDKARYYRFLFGGLFYGFCVIPGTYVVNYPRSIRWKFLLTIPAAIFGGFATASNAEHECVLAVINKNTPLAREMEDFLRRHHPDYPALREMRDFSKIEDRLPSISWLKANDPVRFKDFQFSEQELEEIEQKQEQDDRGMKPFGGMKERGMLADLKESRQIQGASSSGEVLDFWNQVSSPQYAQQDKRCKTC